ncbi:MAG: alpha-galactosidase [Clostridia bacterium]|nr:alpha-galactosidase [Clostridia bacterium]
MAIIYDAASKTLSLHTQNTTYQMQIGDMSHLFHLYFGRRVDAASLAYRIIPSDRGFSPNPFEARYHREISLDTLPQEYPGANSGDFRVPALDLIGENGAVGTDLRYLRHEIRAGKYALSGLPAAFAEAGEAETLSVTLGDAATGLEVELLYGVFEAADMLTRAAIIRNTGTSAVTLNRVGSLCLDIPFGRWELLHLHGRHCMERNAERAPLMRGIQTVSSRRGASSHHHNPFVALVEPSATETRGECVGILPLYSGNHRTDIEVDQTESVRVVSGINPDAFSWYLKPGDSFTAPEAALCFTDGGLGDLSIRLHRFIRRHIIRSPWKDRRRPVLINSWEAMLFDFDSERLMRFAKQAAALGVEMMVLDDGWFGARNSDLEGLGDWTPNAAKLPGGLKPLSDAVHDLGMKFGLWIEPEMVNELSALYAAHPDWALTVPGRNPAFGRNQLVLDMGRNEVVEHLYGVFSALLRDGGIDYIKWDMNRNMTDVYSRALPPERQREASHRYMLGVYDLLDRLTTAFPEVLFEGCAGGGGRFDAGMLYYTPQIWCSDDTDAIERIAIQQGTSVAYPVSTMGAHVSVCPNQQTGRNVPFGVRGIVAMSGTFGYELDPAQLTEGERQRIRVQIDRFHRWYDVIQCGDCHRLTEFADPGDFTAWEFVTPDRNRALLNVVTVHTRANHPGAHVRLRGLDPAGMYKIDEVCCEGCVNPSMDMPLDGAALEGRVLSGASLMYAGFTLPPLMGDYPGAQVSFIRVGPDGGIL